MTLSPKLAILFGAIALIALGASCTIGPIVDGCEVDTDCGDGLFCNGSESCNEGICLQGEPPCGSKPEECPSCDEDRDACIGSCSVDADCDDGIFCNGEEICDECGVCRAGTPPCENAEQCDEESDICRECRDDTECDDGLYCNGDERCGASSGRCYSVGNYPCGICDEGSVACRDGCFCEEPGYCASCCAEDPNCSDGVFCNGEETCDDGLCVAGIDPCVGQNNENEETGTLACNENAKACLAICAVDADCSDNFFCNGVETCGSDMTCVAGEDPCASRDCGTVEKICSEGDTNAVCTCLWDLHGDIFFTLNQDSITATTGDDIFDAALLFRTGEFGPFPSLQTGDFANGRAGTDVLNATFLDGGIIEPTLIEIEVFKLTDFGSASTILDATNVSGVEEINADSSIQTVTVDRLATIVDLGITNSASGISVTFLTEATNGPADALTLTLSECMDGPDSNVAITTGADNGFETITIESVGDAPNVLGSLTQITGTTLTTLIIKGDQDLTLKAYPSTVQTIDTSGMTAVFVGP